MFILHKCSQVKGIKKGINIFAHLPMDMKFGNFA
jgi:hypothetical protein